MQTERIEFSTIREDFNVYKVENGQILKVKVAVLDILNSTSNDGKKESKVQTQLNSAVITPEGMDTTNMEFGDPNLTTEKDQTKELKFETIKEVINIYETKKSFIFTGILVTKIFATNKKTKTNEPILRYNSTTGIGVAEKPIFDPYMSKSNSPT